jgi:hypothetical protein
MARKHQRQDFAQTAYSVFHKATGAKPNTRQSAQRNSRSGRGK